MGALAVTNLRSSSRRSGLQTNITFLRSLDTSDSVLTMAKSNDSDIVRTNFKGVKQGGGQNCPTPWRNVQRQSDAGVALQKYTLQEFSVYRWYV